jgi:hypothetical protein
LMMGRTASAKDVELLVLRARAEEVDLSEPMRPPVNHPPRSPAWWSGWRGRIRAGATAESRANC